MDRLSLVTDLVTAWDKAKGDLQLVNRDISEEASGLDGGKRCRSDKIM
jgi:hypothetical protein